MRKQANSESAGKRRADAGDAPRGAKRVKGNSGAARAASLNTVLAAVEEQRAGRQGSAALDAAVGCAPTTVEDCLQASSFGVIRKVGCLHPCPHPRACTCLLASGSCRQTHI